MPPPIQRRREDGGHFPSRKEAKQILLFGDTTSHARRQHLLGGTYACRSGPGRMAFDISGSGGHPCPASPHLHGCTSFLGKHVVVGQSITHRGAWMDKRSYFGWLSLGRYGWLISPRALPEPMLSGIRARMHERTRPHDWIFLRIIPGGKRI
jgi:hypothetical protein